MPTMRRPRLMTTQRTLDIKINVDAVVSISSSGGTELASADLTAREANILAAFGIAPPAMRG